MGMLYLIDIWGGSIISADDEKIRVSTIPCGFHGNFSMNTTATVATSTGSTKYVCSGYMSNLEGCDEVNVTTVQLTCQVNAAGM